MLEPFRSRTLYSWFPTSWNRNCSCSGTLYIWFPISWNRNRSILVPCIFGSPFPGTGTVPFWYLVYLVPHFLEQELFLFWYLVYLVPHFLEQEPFRSGTLYIWFPISCNRNLSVLVPCIFGSTFPGTGTVPFWYLVYLVPHFLEQEPFRSGTLYIWFPIYWNRNRSILVPCIFGSPFPGTGTVPFWYLVYLAPHFLKQEPFHSGTLYIWFPTSFIYFFYYFIIFYYFC